MKNNEHREAGFKHKSARFFIKFISLCFSSAYVEILSSWEVWRALKRLELLSAAPRATLTPLSCSANFPRAQYLDIRTLTHGLIINLSIALLFSRFSLLFCLLFRFLVSFRNRYVICLSYFSVTLVFIKSVVSIQKSLYIVLVHSFYNHNLKAEG